MHWNHLTIKKLKIKKPEKPPRQKQTTNQSNNIKQTDKQTKKKSPKINQTESSYGFFHSCVTTQRVLVEITVLSLVAKILTLVFRYPKRWALLKSPAFTSHRGFQVHISRLWAAEKKVGVRWFKGIYLAVEGGKFPPLPTAQMSLNHFHYGIFIFMEVL